MALSGFFLLFFLLQHLTINLLSLCSEDTFNSVSHFMGYNAIVQYILQPVLIFGVLFHLIMGMYLEYQNTKARNKKYAKHNSGASSSWMSRNMLITGITILLFLGLHFYDFWIAEINYKYVVGLPEDPTRYFAEVQHKFVDIWRVAIYVVSFMFLSLHLMHGFQSAFQSVGFRHNKYTPIIKKLGMAYAILVPLGFIIIAVYHHICISHT
ncbi:MAG: succinate dehydrogenase / fumarate reductase cytochrome b subunit [Arenicella sp.]|jgi:succinate dehydrogenase / fumarate reductase cytochrome b subunit